MRDGKDDEPRGPDIGAALADLERKLDALEREIGSAGDEQMNGASTPESPAPAAPAPRSAGRSPDVVGPVQREELEAFRDHIEETMLGLLAGYDRMLRAIRPGGAAPSAGQVAAAAQPPAPLHPSAPGPSLPPLGAGDDLQVEGAVTLDAGPFHDIAALGRFEQALARLPGVGDVDVKGFEGHRAIIGAELEAPVAIAAEMQRVAGLSVAVHRQGAVLVLDVEGIPAHVS